MAAPRDQQNLVHDWNRAGQEFRPAGPVTLDDETLRDGLQNPSVTDPPLAAKAELVRLMDRLGIHTVNVGLPGAGERAFRDCLGLARVIADEKLRITPNVACRTVIQDIEPVRRIMDETGIPVRAFCFIGSSPIRCDAENWTLDTILGHIETSLAYAQRAGIPTAIVTEDTTRSHPDALARIYTLAVELGAERAVVCDTCGHATPEGTRRVVRHVADVVRATGRDVKIDWHGHRDRGLALANCLAAVEAGASQIHGAALGVGERAGNAEMDILLVNLGLLGWITNDLSCLAEYCETAARILRVTIPPNYPVFGHDAFLTGTGVHAAAVIKALRRGDRWLADRVYSGVPAGDFGLSQKIGIGYMSGKWNVLHWLAEHGLPTDDETLVKRILDAAKASDHMLTDAEIRAALGR